MTEWTLPMAALVVGAVGGGWLVAVIAAAHGARSAAVLTPHALPALPQQPTELARTGHHPAAPVVVVEHAGQVVHGPVHMPVLVLGAAGGQATNQQVLEHYHAVIQTPTPAPAAAPPALPAAALSAGGGR